MENAAQLAWRQKTLRADKEARRAAVSRVPAQGGALPAGVCGDGIVDSALGESCDEGSLADDTCFDRRFKWIAARC